MDALPWSAKVVVISGDDGAAPAPFGKEAEPLAGLGRGLRLIAVVVVVVMGALPPLNVAIMVAGTVVGEVVSMAESLTCRLRRAKSRGRRS